LLRLPETESCSEAFGKVGIHDPKNSEASFVQARASFLYDVMNNICIDGVIESRSKHERELSKSHFEHLQEGDIIIFDRGYPGYEFFKELRTEGVDYIARCSSVFSKSFQFSKGERDKHISVKSCKYKSKKSIEFSESLNLRALKIKLPTGEEEILVTSLADESKYPYKIFKELYGMRWGIETMFKVLKSRLGLENFTGKTAEAVRQDFYSTILISNLETILTQELNTELESKSKSKYPQKVNKSVSFNAIRDRAFELLSSEVSLDILMEDLSKLLLQNLTVVRKDRLHPPRVKKTKRARDPLVNYYRNIAKINF
jgi:hypothetical protein